MDLSNEINIDNLNNENKDCININFNTLNQNNNESIQIEKKELDQKEVSNLLSVKSYKYIFNDLNDNIKEIINALVLCNERLFNIKYSHIKIDFKYKCAVFTAFVIEIFKLRI